MRGEGSAGRGRKRGVDEEGRRRRTRRAAQTHRAPRESFSCSPLSRCYYGGADPRRHDPLLLPFSFLRRGFRFRRVLFGVFFLRLGRVSPRQRGVGLLQRVVASRAGVGLDVARGVGLPPGAQRAHHVHHRVPPMYPVPPDARLCPTTRSTSSLKSCTVTNAGGWFGSPVIFHSLLASRAIWYTTVCCICVSIPVARSLSPPVRYAKMTRRIACVATLGRGRVWRR